MRNIDRHLGFWISIASNGLAVALMAAPIYFQTLPAGLFFIGGVLVFFVGSAVVAFLLIRENRQTRSIERKSMIGPILIMIIGALAFCGGAIWFYTKLPPGLLTTNAQVSQPGGIGGKGGSGTIQGNQGTIIGGRGGDGGALQGGRGGDGGGGSIAGAGGLIIGGDGGNAGTAEGRGGKSPRSPGDVAGLPTNLWKFGRGGSGANAPEYNRRVEIITRIRSEYIEMFPDTALYINAGIDQVPVNWTNKRLEEMGESWRVILENGQYKLPPLSSAR